MARLQLSTDRQVAGLKPAAKVYEIGVGGSRGLGVRVFPTGLRQFEFRYVAANGTRRRLGLGAYPDLSLAEARSKVAGLRIAVLDGADPVAEKTAARERARTGETLDQLAAAYWQAATVGLHGGRRRPKRDVTLSNERQMWRNHIQPRLGARPFTEIRRADVKVFMRTLVTESRWGGWLPLTASECQTCGSCRNNHERREPPKWRLSRSGWIWPRAFSRFTR